MISHISRGRASVQTLAVGLSISSLHEHEVSLLSGDSIGWVLGLRIPLLSCLSLSLLLLLRLPPVSEGPLAYLRSCLASPHLCTSSWMQ